MVHYSTVLSFMNYNQNLIELTRTIVWNEHISGICVQIQKLLFHSAANHFFCHFFVFVFYLYYCYPSVNWSNGLSIDLIAFSFSKINLKSSVVWKSHSLYLCLYCYVFLCVLPLRWCQTNSSRGSYFRFTIAKVL